MARISSQCVLRVISTPPTSGTVSALWWDGKISKVAFVPEGIGSMLMSVGSMPASQRNANSPQHILVENKSMCPKSQLGAVCAWWAVCMWNSGSCNPWTALLAAAGICALKDIQSMSKRERVESRPCWSFHLSLTFWILLDLKSLSAPAL